MKVETREATASQLEYALRKWEGGENTRVLDAVPFNMLAYRVQRQYEVSISYRDSTVVVYVWRHDNAMMYETNVPKNLLDEGIVGIVLRAYVGDEIEVEE